VTLNIDTSKAIRTLPDQQALVQAILDARKDTPETHWVEWKSQVDAAERRWQAELSRQILGFANRDPEEAANWVGGCAYIVVGAEPGNLVGTVIYDATKLEDWFSKYVGIAPDAPKWAATYVPMAESKRVLLITVEPPELRDPIWTVRKAYLPDERTRPRDPTEPLEPTVKPLLLGSILARRKSSTDIARPDQVAMLTRRACATQRRIGGLSLIALPESRAVAIDMGEAVMNAWADSERAALKPAPPPPTPKVRGNDRERDAMLDLGLESKFNTLAAALGDSRTAAHFQREVEAYVGKGLKMMPMVLIAGAVHREMGRIDLLLRNETKRNLRQVEVELIIDAKHVLAYFSVGFHHLPERPVALGKGSRFGYGLAGMDLPPYALAAPNPVTYRRQIDNRGPCRIRFDPVDLYPEKSEALDTIYLVTGPGHAGKTLTGTWTAVAKDADDTHRGTMEIEIDSKVPSMDELLAEPTDDANKDF
jgi:hypothetical protein